MAGEAPHAGALLADYLLTRKADNKNRGYMILKRRYGPMASDVTAEQFNCIIKSATMDACHNS